MKYVSPIYEVEAISSEDIMSVSEIATSLGIALSGDKNAIERGVQIELTDGTGSSEGVSQDPNNTTASGVSISMNFGSLFN